MKINTHRKKVMQVGRWCFTSYSLFFHYFFKIGPTKKVKASLGDGSVVADRHQGAEKHVLPSPVAPISPWMSPLSDNKLLSAGESACFVIGFHLQAGTAADGDSAYFFFFLFTFRLGSSLVTLKRESKCLIFPEFMRLDV